MKMILISRYLTAVGLVLAAWAFQALVGHNFGEVFVFVPFLIAAVLTSWLAGFRATLLSLVLGYLVVALFYVNPASPLILGKDNVVALGIYVVIGLSTGLLAESLHRAVRDAEALAGRLRVTFQSMSDAVMVTDAQARITSLNPKAAELLGRSEEAVIGLAIDQIYSIRDERTGQEIDNPVSQILRDGLLATQTDHLILLRPDGSSLPIEHSAAPIQNKSGEVDGAVLVVRDVHERREATRLVQESERRFRRVLENMPVGLIAFDEAANIIVWNKECERLMGFSATEIVEHENALELILPDPIYRHKILRQWQERGNSYRNWELDVCTKDGSTRTLAWSNISREFPISGWASWGIAYDVTDRKRAERHLHRLLAAAPVGIYQTDAQGDCLFVNERWCEIAGISRDAALGSGWAEAVHPEDRQRVSETWYGVAPVGKEFHIEFRFLHPSGEIRWVDSRANAIYDEAGEVLGFLGAVTDVTSRMKAEREHALYMHLLENMNEGVSLATEEGTIIYTNPAEDRMFGYEPGELVGRNVAIQNAYPDTENERIVGAVMERLKTEGSWTGDWQNKRKDGTQFVSSSQISALELEGSRHYLCVQRDVTEQRRAEEALQHSERTAQHRLALLDTIYDTAPVGLGLLDAELRYVRINRLLATMDGKTPEQCIGRPLRELVPELADRLEPIYRRVLETGEPVIARELHGTTPADPGNERDWLASYYPVHGPDGSVVGVSSVVLDITERKRTEESLREADRRKNEFLAMLAHELRNPLAAIRYAANISRLPNLSETDFDVAEVIERQVEYLAHLVDDLLDISRITQGRIRLRREIVNTETIVRRAVEAVRPALEEKEHELTLDLYSGPLPVSADATRLEQVCQNLLNNAAKYTERGGRIRLTTRAEGGQAVIAVSDSGVGIPHGLLTQVFDPFVQGEQTLDRSQGGLGIGLTLVRQIVELHGGTVHAASEGMGHGSTFTVRLPMVESTAAETSHSRSASCDHSTAKRVLVVEDNRDAAKMLQLILKAAGHEVTLCHTGTGAAELAGEFLPDVVLLDIGLPGKDGYEVARELRSTESLRGVRIVALSGYGQDADRAKSQAAGFDEHLVKPVDTETLRALLS